MLQVKPLLPQDYASVQAIYQQGIDFGFATFQTSVLSWAEWDKYMLPRCRLLAVLDGQVVGWAALSAISSWPVYRGVADVSIYIAKNARGKGVGHQLLQRLVADSEQQGFWTLQAGIFPENQASVALHRRNGFQLLGVHKKFGQLNGEWRDVVLMERRSDVVGV
ncbi:GNAT family N-acetyltransferase [Shewanella sp.]|uniref:GNAT family N-acetyltransferase n=1 Tax=Shewanella sp. TaxID=50422 RepID=UPI003A981404